MPTCMMLLSLKLQEPMNGGHRLRIRTVNLHFSSPWAIARNVRDRAPSLGHHGGARHLLRVHLEWLREVAGAKRGLDVAQVRANGADGGGVGRVVAVQHHAPA